MIEVVYFAWVRTMIGQSRETMELPAGARDVAGLAAILRARSAGHAKALADLEIVRCAINLEMVEVNHPVKDGDEVAFFPPMTGG